MCAKCDGLLKKLWLNSKKLIKKRKRPEKVCKKKEGRTLRSGISMKKKKSNGAGFGKVVILPFICGVLGAALTVGLCVNVPSIKQAFLEKLVVTDSSNKDNNSSENNLIISNLLGEEVLTEKVNSNTHSINIKHLSSGTYFVTIKNRESVITQKIIKE